MMHRIAALAEIQNMEDHEVHQYAAGGIAVENLTKTFGTVVAVDNISLSVLPGEHFALLGTSGSGKTTTLRMICGLERQTAGRIIVNGEDVSRRPANKRNVGLVFQDLALFPHMTVFENIAYGMQVRRRSKDEIQQKVGELLDMVGMSRAKFGDRLPAQLSGGQKQRVAIARALATDPPAVLFDEPLASLDRGLRDHMLTELRAIQMRAGFTSIYVTHDQEAAFLLADRIAVMADGRIQQLGTSSDLYNSPVSESVARFLGDINVLDSSVLGIAESGGDLAVGIQHVRCATLPPGAAVGSAQRVGIRPEAIHITDVGPNVLTAEVVDIKFGGDVIRANLQLEGVARPVMAKLNPSEGSDLWIGQRVRASIDPVAVRVLSNAQSPAPSRPEPPSQGAPSTPPAAASSVAQSHALAPSQGRD